MFKVPLAKMIRAVLARVLFAIHGLIVIWRVSSTYKDKTYWLFTIFLIALFVEGGLVIYQRQGNETTWFCLSVFLYLCSVVPPLWFLQLELCRKSLITVRDHNSTSLLSCDKELAVFEFSNEYKFAVCIPLDLEIWVQLMQQTMLVILILGRWILPKGDISRDHLSQILLVFLGMAADMVELFDTFKEKMIKSNYRLTEIVLTVWSVSLIQFPLVLTGRSSKKSRFGYMRHYGHSNGEDSAEINMVRKTGRRNNLANYLCSVQDLSRKKFFFHLLTNDINFWGVITGILLQDAPFLVTRLYLLIKHEALSYTMIFFTCKNILVVMLQSYRLCVIFMETYLTVTEAVETFGEKISSTRGSHENIMRLQGQAKRCNSVPVVLPLTPVNSAKNNRRRSSLGAGEIYSTGALPHVVISESRDTVESTVSLVDHETMRYSCPKKNGHIPDNFSDYYDIDNIMD